MDTGSLFDLIPEPYATYVAGVVILCKILTIIIQPPDATSKWAGAYRLVSLAALNVGWAKNQYRVGLTGKMVPRDQSHEAAKVLSDAAIPVKKTTALPFAKDPTAPKE